MSVRATHPVLIGRIIASLWRHIYSAIVALALVTTSVSANLSRSTGNLPAVHPLFDLSTPARSPFPSDRFTVADSRQNTGRRVALPLPDDCVANASDCNDVTVSTSSTDSTSTRACRSRSTATSIPRVSRAKRSPSCRYQTSTTRHPSSLQT